ncbi:hypothetical protein LARI1_G008946 [Lachnellula arida]|uniref:DUF6594 domain-containing protein n=1 Tax=Lachnellula arida TaxID=1316785 RepID=A0A8T9B0I7_9HELO|nr:hypothetical protein LARI1_G008946 [Lachnellula arida]
MIFIRSSYTRLDKFVAHRGTSWVSRAIRALVPTPAAHSTRKVIRNLLVEQYPQGYPRLAAFLDSDENFMIYRRFGYLHARLLLYKQDELRAFEKQLDRMDRKDAYPGTQRFLQCRESDDYRVQPVGKSRKELLRKIENTIVEYDQLLFNAQRLTSSNRPAQRDHNSVIRFIYNTQPLVQGESEFVHNNEDMITLRPGRESTWFDSFVEDILIRLPWRPVKYIFCLKEAAEKTTDENIRYFTKSRVDRLVSSLVFLTLILMLILPVYILYHIGRTIYDIKSQGTVEAVCISILLVFTLLFSAILALFTKAKRHEILGAATAYCAILVVFLGNFSNPVSVHT